MAVPNGGLITETNEQYYDGNNYGSYRYILMNDVVNNFLISYVGNDKIFPYIKRSDIIFHAKRAMQEFSYDVLKSIKSQELTVPNSLALPIPQDLVNYVKLSWVDSLGVKHVIKHTRLTSNPTEIPSQDNTGALIQNESGENIGLTSITEENWSNANTNKITGAYSPRDEDTDTFIDPLYKTVSGQRFGATPEHTQINGWFTINEREGKFSFSSDLVDKTIILEYISDGLAYDEDTKIPKLAEDAFYAYIAYAVASVRPNVPEYIINRFKKEKRSKMRNAKLRLSSIKIEEISQVFRNKSKWIKH